MPRPKGGLGRGLDSLFADLPDTSAEEGAVVQLPLREIEPDPAQPRTRFEEGALAELAQSIAENGLLQPVTVRPKKAGAGYILVAGERRWRAARLAGLTQIPALVRDVGEEQAAVLALVENLQREDLDPMELAQGCQRLMQAAGLTQQQLAQRLGKSRSAIANSLRLLSLPPAVQQRLRDGTLSAGHAKALLALAEPAAIEDAARQAAERGLSVRQTEALCRRLAKKNGPTKNKAAAQDAFTRPALAVEVEAALREATGSEVHVDYRDGRGTLRIDFYSDDMLRTLAQRLGGPGPRG